MQLPQGVPIFLTYVTAQVRDGTIAYLPDPYGLDKGALPKSQRATKL